MQVRIEFEADPLRAIMDALPAPGFSRVAALALNDTVQNAQGETVALLRPMMGGVPPETITDALSIQQATPDHLEARLVGGGKAIPMIQFHPRASRAEGVTIEIAGKTETYHRAFIATVRHGHIGVFERKGRERLPIRELYGPSVHGMMARTDVLPRIGDRMQTRLLVNLRRQLDRAVHLATGTHGGAE